MLSKYRKVVEILASQYNKKLIALRPKCSMTIAISPNQYVHHMTMLLQVLHDTIIVPIHK